MLERLKVRKRKRLLKKLKEAMEHDRTEQILKIQMRGFSPEFLNYVP